MKITLAELKAYNILGEAGLIPFYSSTNPSIDAHEAGNMIIELAERIKSERQIVAMEK